MSEASAADEARAALEARSDATVEYRRRLAERALSTRRLEARERTLSHLRLVVFAAGAIAAWFAFGSHQIDRAAVLPFLAGFVGLAIWHDRTIRARERGDRAVAWYERGLARIEDRWSGGGTSGERFRDPAHPYADDLDLFGEGSLFELLCSARTAMGEEALASWLLAPAPPAVVRVRHGAVNALRGALDLREDLASLAAEATARLAPQALLRWGEGAGPAPGIALRLTPAVTSLVTVATLVAWILGALPPLGFAIALLAQAVTGRALHRRSQTAVEGLDGATRSLDALALLVERLQAEDFEEPHLSALRSELASGQHSAAREIARLRRLAELLDSRRNTLFLPIAALLLWGTQFGLAIDAWRSQCGPQLAHWLAAIGELEALASLSAYAYEHPRDPFPELIDGEGAHFEADALGHPLLPAASCVHNDLQLDSDRPIRLVSGSNMSGKSTWLRAVGVASVLAQAGAPVRARRLRISPLAIGASLRIVDSLQAGTSHFYAEIQRLRQIVDLASADADADSAGGPTLLFLLDEILHGTNSHDRRIGAEAIVRGLLERGALGLVTTHDLALTRIADQLAPRVDNQHFADHLEEGKLVFDYQLRRGVVQHSNALALMREVGLDV